MGRTMGTGIIVSTEECVEHPLTKKKLDARSVLVAVLEVSASFASTSIPEWTEMGPGFASFFELVGKVIGWPLVQLSGEGMSLLLLVHSNFLPFQDPLTLTVHVF